MNAKQTNLPIHILLADDDKDDRFFFEKALNKINIPTKLTFVDNGKKLMDYLLENTNKLPDVLFLDLNMPLKNGSECLEEIIANEKLKRLPVIIHTTASHVDIAESLYEKGIHYYVRKTDLAELEKILFHILSSLIKNKFARPKRSEFILNKTGSQF